MFSFASEIPIASTLSLDDYYATDPHWRQEAILEQARTIATAMGVKLAEDFTEETIRENFTAQQGLRVYGRTRGYAEGFKVAFDERLDNLAL